MAKDQPQYAPLRCLAGRTAQGQRLSRWTLTPQQREAIAGGADIFLELWTFNGPMNPIRMAVSDSPNADYFKAEYRLPDPMPGTLTFVVNGHGYTLACDLADTFFSLMDQVEQCPLAQFTTTWELRDRNGRLLEKLRSPSAIGIKDGDRLFVNAPVGIGG